LIKNLLRLLALIETWLPTDTALQLAVRRNLPPTGFLGEKLAVTPLVFGCHLRINFIKNLSKGSSSKREREKKKSTAGGDYHLFSLLPPSKAIRFA